MYTPVFILAQWDCRSNEEEESNKCTANHLCQIGNDQKWQSMIYVHYIQQNVYNYEDHG